MREYEIYLPSARNDGTPIATAEIDRLKRMLAKAFGGYTHLNHRCEGVWSMGGVTFRDVVTIVRVLDDGTADFDMRAFKSEAELALEQQTLLIVERSVAVIS